VVRLAIRRQERVDGGGGAHVARLVFCPARQCSRRLDECRRCVHLLRLEDAVVECAPGSVEGARRGFPDPGLGGDVCVGEAMSGYAVSLAGSAPLAAVVEALRRAPPAVATAVVVNEDDRVIGVIELPDAMRAADEVRANALAHPVAPMRESATLAAAVARMTKERRRMLPIVDDAGRAVGLVSDLDALRWVARRRPAP
jgi:CBS domain-containing protein